MDVATNRVGIPANLPNFIDPTRPTSMYLGDVAIEAGPVGETAVPAIRVRTDPRTLRMPSCWHTNYWKRGHRAFVQMDARADAL